MEPQMSARASSEDGPRQENPAGTAGWSGVPERPRQFLARPRLLDLLEPDERCPLVLVSAPAGTGKTALVVDWVTTRTAARTEWITFEADEPFWPGFVGCLERLGVPVSATSLPAGRAALDGGVRRGIASSIASEATPITVVVDGYEVDSAAVAGDLDFLLRHTGHRLRLVLLTRADPVMPLYRYRLEETVTEVRMADLAFTDEEAGALLDKMGVRLAPESVHSLNARTKGWVTGLRFAGKMLVDRDDPDEGVEQVVGDSGSIAEYLMGEVLAAHPPLVREQLMAMSIPDTIQPGLAEALAGRSAARTLAFLVRVNVFIENVPGHAGHYRYHPFFRELLRAELAYGSPETMVTLQRRAADWFAEQGLLTSSVRHYASVGAWEEAADQVVDNAAVGQLVLDDGSSALAETLKGLPDDLETPAAAVVRATLALTDGDTDVFQEQLGRVRSHGGEQSPHDQALTLAVAVLVAIRARFSDDPGEAEVLAQAAQEALAQEATRSKVRDHPELAALVLATKGIATIRQGHLDEADEIFRAGAGAAVEAGADPLLVECLGYLALLACCAGDLTRGEALAARAIRAATDAGIPVGDRSAAARVALAWVAVERYELRAALDHVRSAERSDFILGDPVPRALLTVVKARLQVAQGDRAGALSRVSDAVGEFADPGSWLVRRMRIEAAQLKVVSGEPEAALAEIEGLGVEGAGAEPALVVSQAWLRLGDDAAAADSLAVALGQKAPQPVRVSGWLVESARQLHNGSTMKARQALDSALQLAVTPRLRRPFHEAPTPVRQLLLQDPQLVASHAWLFEVAGTALPRPRQGRQPVESQTRSAPVERLTEKELEVLGHLAELLTTEEIAAVMYISVNTVRTHVRNILRKFGVSRRNAAVRMARELEMLPG